MTTPAAPSRPTCGTCPHFVQSRHGETYCYATPDCSGGTQQVLEDDPGCIHHPDMPAYVEAWKLAREKPQ